MWRILPTLAVLLLAACGSGRTTMVVGELELSYSNPHEWHNEGSREVEVLYGVDPDLYLADLVEYYEAYTWPEKFELLEEVMADTRVLFALYEEDPNLMSTSFNARVTCYLWQGWTRFPHTKELAKSDILAFESDNAELKSEDVLAFRLDGVNFYGYEFKSILYPGVEGAYLEGTFQGTPLYLEIAYSNDEQRRKIMDVVNSIRVVGI